MNEMLSAAMKCTESPTRTTATMAGHRTPSDFSPDCTSVGNPASTVVPNNQPTLPTVLPYQENIPCAPAFPNSQATAYSIVPN